MSAPAKPAKDHGSFLLNNPAISATVITLIITGAFIGALAQAASGHHGGGHGAPGAHGAASGAPSASGHAAGSAAPAATAAPAAH